MVKAVLEYSPPEAVNLQPEKTSASRGIYAQFNFQPGHGSGQPALTPPGSITTGDRKYGLRPNKSATARYRPGSHLRAPVNQYSGAATPDEGRCPRIFYHLTGTLDRQYLSRQQSQRRPARPPVSVGFRPGLRPAPVSKNRLCQNPQLPPGSPAPGR